MKPYINIPDVQNETVALVLREGREQFMDVGGGVIIGAHLDLILKMIV